MVSARCWSVRNTMRLGLRIGGLKEKREFQKKSVPFRNIGISACAPSRVALRCLRKSEQLIGTAGYKPAGRTGHKPVFLVQGRPIFCAPNERTPLLEEGQVRSQIEVWERKEKPEFE